MATKMSQKQGQSGGCTPVAAEGQVARQAAGEGVVLVRLAQDTGAAQSLC